MTIQQGQMPKEIKTSLSFKGEAEKFTIHVTYNNLTLKDYLTLIQGDSKNFSDVLFALIHDWDAGYPLSVEGLDTLEDEHPGVLRGLFDGYLRARRVELEKN